MILNEIPPPSETPAPLPETAQTIAQPPKRFGKKLYIAVGIIAIVIVASTLTFVFLPKGEARTIALGFNYNAGEKMIYSMPMSITMNGQTVSQTATASLEILDFDGQNYTIRETIQVASTQTSYTIKMDKTGRIVDFDNLPANVQQIYTSIGSIPGYGSYFPKTSAKTGESWEIPMHIVTGTFSMDGTAHYVATEIKNITVPAGTYNAFKVEMTANVQGTIQSSGLSMSINANLNGYAYLEMGTGRLIDLNVQESMTGTYSGQTISLSLTLGMQLTQHIK